MPLRLFHGWDIDSRQADLARRGERGQRRGERGQRQTIADPCRGGVGADRLRRRRLVPMPGRGEQSLPLPPVGLSTLHGLSLAPFEIRARCPACSTR